MHSRLSQRKYSVRTAQPNNTLLISVGQYNHTIDWKNSVVLCRSNHMVNRNLFDSTIIQLPNHIKFKISKGIYGVILSMFSKAINAAIRKILPPHIDGL